jgi:hypothetical protein
MAGMKSKRRLTKRRRRQQKRSRKLRRNQRGGGYSVAVNQMISPGNPVNLQYQGVGMDCAGSPQRAGTLDGIGMLQNPGGLPGLSNNVFSGMLKGGGSQLGSGGIVVQNNGLPVIENHQNGGTLLGVAVNDGEMPGSAGLMQPARSLPTDPAGYTYQYMRDAQAQKGGRYGADLAAASSQYGSNGVGYAGIAPTGRVACESGSYDALNADRALQLQTTNTMTNNVPGFAPYIMKGGKSRRKRRQQKKKNKQGGGGTNAENLANAAPYYFAGQVDSMKYNAPTAGYAWQPLMPQVSNNPGVNDYNTYDARHFNPACMKTN